jgi:hypothetical protein
MLRLKPIFATSFLLLAVVLAASTAQAQKTNPNLEIPKGPIKVFLPDLRITNVTINGGKMEVEVTNMCKAAAGGNRLVLVLNEGPDKKSKPGEQVELDVPPLKAGEKTTLTYNMQEYKSKYTTFIGRHYRLEVDATNKVKEAQEGNNYFEKGAIPFPNGPHSCDPK